MAKMTINEYLREYQRRNGELDSICVTIGIGKEYEPLIVMEGLVSLGELGNVELDIQEERSLN